VNDGTSFEDSKHTDAVWLRFQNALTDTIIVDLPGVKRIRTSQTLSSGHTFWRQSSFHLTICALSDRAVIVMVPDE
jgi:hypothetical protein